MAETSLRWPDDLPWEMRRDGFARPTADARERRSADDGPGRLRRRLGVALRPFQGAIDLAPHEWARLERFWDEDTRGGVLPFWFRNPLRFGLPLSCGPGRLPLLTADGRSIRIESWLLCQFGEQAPQPAPIAGGRLRVSLALVELP